jgi:TonB family protein
MTLPFDSIEGKYEILGKLREGGMGAVYKVRHRLLEEIRVIKIIHPRLGVSEEASDRFLREARLAIQLRHPNIAQLHDFAIGEDGRAFIVMEHIDGLTLEEMLRTTGPPPLGLGLEIARLALQAVGYLHRKGFIHRDISPDNLMLTRDLDERPLVKLIDLGIAKVLKGDPGLTSSGLFLGKPRYASPEQFGAGGSATIDARSDLYSFGAVLYKLLTGTGPIAGTNPASLMAGHLFREPVPFAESDPEGTLPSDLRAVLLKTLAKRPEDRFASAEELARALAPIQARFPLGRRDLDAALGLSATQVIPPAPPPGTTQERLDREFAKEPTAPPAGRWTNAEPTIALPAAATAAIPAPKSKGELVAAAPPRESPAPARQLERAPPAAEAPRQPAFETPQGAIVTASEGAVHEARERAGSPGRRKGLGWAALAAAVLLIAALGAWLGWPEYRATQVSRRAPAALVPAPAPRVSPPALQSPLPAPRVIASGSLPAIPASLPTATPDGAPSLGNPPPPGLQPERPTVTDRPAAVPVASTAIPRRPLQGGKGPKAARSRPAPGEPSVRPKPQARKPQRVVVPLPDDFESEAPEPLSVPTPAYPEAARGSGTYAAVTLAIRVDESGGVKDVRVERSVVEGSAPAAVFETAALAAARRARFQPGRKRGSPVASWLQTTFEFGTRKPKP